jgi:hypothetical protein
VSEDLGEAPIVDRTAPLSKGVDAYAVRIAVRNGVVITSSGRDDERRITAFRQRFLGMADDVAQSILQSMDLNPVSNDMHFGLLNPCAPNAIYAHVPDNERPRSAVHIRSDGTAMALFMRQDLRDHLVRRPHDTYRLLILDEGIDPPMHRMFQCPSTITGC